MREYQFELAISADDILAYYQGAAKTVVTEDITGLRIQIPAQSLRPFVTREGVHGRFCVRVDQNNKLLDIRRV